MIISAFYSGLRGGRIFAGARSSACVTASLPHSLPHSPPHLLPHRLAALLTALLIAVLNVLQPESALVHGDRRRRHALLGNAVLAEAQGAAPW